MPPLSNATSLIQIGFSKKELCTIIHNEWIIDWFSRENLYEVPRVIVSTFGPKNDTQKTIVCLISVTIYEIQIQFQDGFIENIKVFGKIKGNPHLLRRSYVFSRTPI